MRSSNAIAVANRSNSCSASNEVPVNGLENTPASTQTICESVVLDFMAHFDAGDASSAAALFAPHGRWHRADGVLQGREALVRLIGARKPNTVVRHVITNLRTRLMAENHAVVSAYVLLLKHESIVGEPNFPVAFEGLAGFGRYVDELRLTDQGWLIESKTSVTEFKRA